MSLPTPIELLSRIKKGIANLLFAIAVILVVAPVVQWGLMFCGVLAVMIGRHWVLGAVLFVLGLGGAFVAKNIRI